MVAMDDPLDPERKRRSRKRLGGAILIAGSLGMLGVAAWAIHDVPSPERGRAWTTMAACAAAATIPGLVAARIRLRKGVTPPDREALDRGRIQRATWVAAPIGAGIAVLLAQSSPIVQVVVFSLMGGFCLAFVLRFLWGTREPSPGKGGAHRPA